LLSGQIVIRGDLLVYATPFGGATLARVIYQNPAHIVRRDGVEVRPILPGHIRSVGHPCPSFVDECGCLESVVSPLAPHMYGGEVA
jgi:hypothetical protein